MLNNGAALDSMLFVFIAFGSLDLAAGTIATKIYAGLAMFASNSVRKGDLE